VDDLTLIADCLKYYHTIRHLKLSQVYHQIRKRLMRHSLDSVSLPQIKTRKSDKWIDFPLHEQSLLTETRFRFLNREYDISDTGWNDPGIDLLWRYNLHYFDDLNAVTTEERKEMHLSLIKRWIDENPPLSRVAWDPYPLSLRMVNWIKWQYRCDGLTDAMRTSLYLQSRCLFRSIEWHLLGNHLFANAKALLFAGMFFDTEESVHWRKKGIEILISEIDEQILSDGGHFERSPMYHSIILSDVLDILNLLQSHAAFIGVREGVLLNSVKKVIPKMLSFLESMSHPDGQISFFNDAAFGIAASPAQLKRYGEVLGISGERSSSKGLQHLKESGYIRLENDSCVAILDVAPVGPEYIPGHAHADTLSFELSLFGERVIVNSGTSCYGKGEDRAWQRSTEAHSTVEVNGENSSEVWGGFRVAKRAYPFDLKIHEDRGRYDISCSHDGYRRISRDIVHRRKWVVNDSEIIIRDIVEGVFGQARAYYYFHPDVRLKFDDPHKGSIILSCGQQVYWETALGKVHIMESTFYPEFNTSLKSYCLVVELVNGSSEVRFYW
jgi:uncharacterized heparinase superfamily protein